MKIENQVIFTLYNMCSVHRGDIMSTSGEYHEYIGGYHEYIGGYHKYIGGRSVHRGDIMMNVGGYHEYTGGCSVHRRDTMGTSIKVRSPIRSMSPLMSPPINMCKQPGENPA